MNIKCTFGRFLTLAAFLLLTPFSAQAASDDAVTFLCNPTHNAAVTTANLGTPLTKLWATQLDADISYPIIAQGLVFVSTSDSNSSSHYGSKLYALNAKTGAIVWGPVSLGGTYFYGACAYESGKLFVVNFDGLLRSFDAATGKSGWSRQLPGQYAFTSAPTAYKGTVYVGGAGSGGTLYAVDETNGAVLWTQSVENGDSSSPAVTDDGVYVSYAGPQSYKFDPQTGNPKWRFSGQSEGGGGATPVLYNGSLYVRDNFDQYNGEYYRGLVLDSTTGSLLSEFGEGYTNQQKPPVFDSGLGVFGDEYGNLQAQDIKSGNILWSFANGSDSDSIVTPPLIVNGNVFVGTSGGTLLALNEATGQVVWSGNVGAAITADGSEQNAITPSALAAGDSLLVVPAGRLLVTYAVAASNPTPASLTLTPNPTDPYTPVTATLTLTAPAPQGGTVVTLTSSDTSLATVYHSLTVPAGHATATFPVTLAQTSSAGNSHLTISAAAGGITLSAPLEIKPFLWTAQALSLGADNDTRLLWTKAGGTAKLWTLTPSNRVIGSPVFGPSDGWTAIGIATGKDNNTRLLWDKTDGSTRLWTVNTNGTLLNQPVFGPFTGWTATAVSVGTDGRSRLLWDNGDGRATLWVINSKNGNDSSPVFGPYKGWTAKAIATGTDGATHLLWTNTDGRATLWTVAPDGTVGSNTPVFGPFSGWTAKAVSTGPDGRVRLLWDNADGRTTVWVINSSNGNDSSPVFGPLSGWSGQALAVGPDNVAHLLWDNVNGQATLWPVSPDGTVGSNTPVFGPF